MDDLLAQQRVAMRAIDRALENFKKIGRANLSHGIVRNRLQTLKENYGRCEQLHAQLLRLATKDVIAAEAYFKEDRFTKLEEIYYATSDYLADTLSQFESPPSSPGSNVSQNGQPSLTKIAYQLPRIHLPKFSGEFRDWEVFRDQFRAMVIENSELSNVSRMHYLCSCLKDEARDALRSLPVTDANFQVAWDLLIARYDNKRRLVHEHIHALTTLSCVSTESAQDLATLRDKAKMSIQSLKNLGRPVEKWDDLLVYLIVQKLDKSTRKAWELQLGDTREYPSYDALDTFLAARIRAFENILPVAISKIKKPSKSSVQSHALNASETQCPMCKQNHFLSACPDFQNKSVQQRRDLITKFRRCVNCLSARHQKATCNSKHNCRQCQQRHHTMLHETKSTVTDEKSPQVTEPESLSENKVASHVVSKAHYNKSRVLLATARIRVSSTSGRQEIIRALLDQGSVTSLVTENLAQRLRLPRLRVTVSITGIGETESVARHAANVTVSSRTGAGPSYTTAALILSSLTKYIPPQSRDARSLDHLRDLNWADDLNSRHDPIEMIIGADLYGSILRPGLRSGSTETPTAQNSIFGWIISGPLSANATPIASLVSINHVTLTSNLETELRRFWEIEELPQRSYLTPEEQRCEEHFRTTHRRHANGQYIVRLPFKTNPPLKIGASRDSALSFMSRLEARLQNQKALASEYHHFLQEYADLGHMEKTDSCKSANQIVYIPHHAVIREHSSTTRLRVVFNASHPSSNGSSLNDHLMIGPKLQPDLRAVILRWRQFRYVYTADIAKMYRQILVDTRDVDYQRILWRTSTSMPMQDYRLLTVTYGTNCAPYLALRTIQQLGNDEGKQFPLALPVLRDHMYVDDCIFGADDKPLAKHIRNQLISLLANGGFQLRKWASNCSALLNDLDAENHGLAQGKNLQADESLKVLGVTWYPTTDAFHFSVEISSVIPRTKRTILSTIAKLFDPMGWLAPTVVTSKILMQQLWATKCSWDEPIPASLMQKWATYHEQLPLLREVSLPRWTGFGADTSHWELHGFADASSAAYAAVIYLKTVSLSGSITVSLLMAKTKVAPLKSLTIPRLELSATVLLARAMLFVCETLELSRVPCHCWTDSTVALAWLRQPPSRWKTFVAHRVNDVQTRIPDAIWHHVPTHQNPADSASRGMTVAALRENRLWWQGPDWLKLSPDQWPDSIQQSSLETALEERNTVPTQTLSVKDTWELASRYSSWPKLLRVTSYIMRFVHRLRSRATHITPSEGDRTSLPPDNLSVNEYQKARLFWLRVIQRDLFPDDSSRLQSSDKVARNSKLISLNPYLDEHGVIRVGGRLRHSTLSYNTKHPIIMGAHPLFTLIIQHAHIRSLHAGNQLTLHVFREEFWILRARQTVRAVLYRCVTCTREKAATPNELMGDLPEMRVRKVDRAFLHCGLDYAGPIPVRMNPGRGQKSRKAYISVFVCMTVRAIHLELVSDLTTEAFLAAFNRFCSRRGKPTDLYSDNAKNFRGADRELTTAVQAVQHNSAIRDKLSYDGIRWHFIPPSAPHFGGLWESGVRSVKHHLKRVIGSHTLTFEEMATLLCRIEACLNSRPLASLSDNLDDYSSLTPGHFLIGSAITAIPAPTLLEIKDTRLTRWQLIQQMTEIIWKAWAHDYLHSLQQRSKWRIAQHLARVGRLVLLRDPLAPPCQWALGRIIECHPGADGVTRVVTVKTARSTYKRPIVKLCFLPIDLSESAAPIP